MAEQDNNQDKPKKNAKQDHLMNFIKDTENVQPEQTNQNIENFGPNTRQKVNKIELNDVWINIPLSDLPYGKFYKTGTKIFVRPTTTKEIQGFAVVNEENPYDVQLKLNEVLASCVKIVKIDDSIGSYRELQDGDRNTLIVIISRISAKHGKKNEKIGICVCSKEEIPIELIPSNYIYKEENADIAQYFNMDECVYNFPLTINGGDLDYKLAPPTIGLTEDINKYIFYVSAKSKGLKMPNITFVECITYIKAGLGVKSLSIETLEQEEYNFSKINEDLFNFVYDTIDLISFGVESIKTNCKKCESEVKVPFTFPDGVRALFIVPNAFKQFIR